MNNRFIPIVATVLLITITGFAQVTVYCPPTQDAFVGALTPNTCYGVGTVNPFNKLLLGYDSGTIAVPAPGWCYSFIKYSLASIPSGATIVSAKIKMQFQQGNGDSGTAFPITAFRVDSSWSESTITYNNRPLNITEVAANNFYIATSPSWYMDITALTQEWYIGSRSNHGIMLMKSDAATDRYLSFYSKEWSSYPTHLDDICLEVTYTLPDLRPVVNSISINNGAASTSSRSVILNNACSNNPTQYMASEDPDFTGADWQVYNSAPSFTLSSANGTKRVYFKTRNEAGESNILSDEILLDSPTYSITVNIHNVAGGSDLVPANYGRVDLYDSEGNLSQSQNTISGSASFAGLVAGAYSYRVYVDYTPLNMGEEYWGAGNVTVPSTAPFEFFRNLPYAGAPVLKDATTGEIISWGSSLIGGRQVRIEVPINNPSNGTVASAFARVFLDRDASLPANLQGQTASVTISPGGQAAAVSGTITFEDTGVYFFGAQTWTSVGSVDTITDTSGFSEAMNISITSQYAPTVLGALAEMANLKGIIGLNPDTTDLQGQYNQGIKSVAYFTSPIKVGLGVGVYIDLCDYYSALHPDKYITQEGRDGWITVWVDGTIGLSFNITPVGFGILQLPFAANLPDQKDSWDFSLLGANIPFLSTTVFSWSSNGIDLGSIDWSPNLELGATIFNLGFSAAHFEVQKGVIDGIIDNQILNGQAAGVYDAIEDFNIAAERFNMEFLDLRDGWKVAPSAIVKNFTYSDTTDEAAPYDGIINHIRGGSDLDSDGIPDNYYPVLPTFYGIPFGGYELEVTFQNTGIEDCDYFIQVRGDLPAGWTIGAVDDDGFLAPIADRKIDFVDVLPVGLTGEWVTSRWAVCASGSAPETAEVTFDLYWDLPWPEPNILLSSKTTTFHKMPASGNIPPSLTMDTPGGNMTVIQGSPVNLAWTDSDPDDNAFILLAFDPDLSDSPWAGTENHVWIVNTLREDDTINQFQWQTVAVPPGTYSVWGMIYDSTNSPIYSRAGGFVTVTAPTGTLQVTLGPAGAVDDGAQWKLTTETVWHATGFTLDLTEGTYILEFMPLGGWFTPSNIQVTIIGSQLNNQSVDYAQRPEIHVFENEIHVQCVAGTNAETQTIYIYNSGGSLLEYSFTPNVDWLACNPPAGNSSGETDSVEVVFSTSALTVDQHVGRILVSDPDATNDPVLIMVYLDVIIPKVPDHIEIEGPNLITGGTSQDYNCRVFYSDNTDSLRDSQWSVSPLTYASITDSGLLTALIVPSDQTCEVTASYTEENITKTATITVTISGYSCKKADFNGDGQEDILWRYQGSGAFQGLNVIWLMRQADITSPTAILGDQSVKGMPSIVMGEHSPIGFSVPQGFGFGSIPNALIDSVLHSSRGPDAKPERIVRTPIEKIGERTNTNGGMNESSEILPARKDAIFAAAPVAGEVTISGFELDIEHVFSQIADTTWEIAGTGDFNGDGKTDILWRNYGTGPYQGLNDIWFMDGTTFVGEAVFSQIADLNWRIAGTGDFNGDGETDILWRYYGTGGYQGLNVVWFMNGSQFAGEAVFSQVLDTDWRIEGTGDFNADGETDILWRYYGTGAYQGLNDIWFMNDTTFVSEAVFSQILDTNWQIGGTGDFNNDGHLDILWRYYGAGPYQGLNDIWYMNGTAFVSEEVFSVIPDTNWRIVNR